MRHVDVSAACMCYANGRAFGNGVVLIQFALFVVCVKGPFGTSRKAVLCLQQKAFVCYDSLAASGIFMFPIPNFDNA